EVGQVSARYHRLLSITRVGFRRPRIPNECRKRHREENGQPTSVGVHEGTTLHLLPPWLPNAGRSGAPSACRVARIQPDTFRPIELLQIDNARRAWIHASSMDAPPSKRSIETPAEPKTSTTALTISLALRR